MAHALFGAHMRRPQAGHPAGRLGLRALDNVFEVLVRGGRDAPMVKALLIPERLGQQRRRCRRRITATCSCLLQLR